MQKGAHSFVVRIWSEAVDKNEDAPPWRGNVEDVLSGDSTHFEDFDDLLDFIRQYMQLSTHDVHTR